MHGSRYRLDGTDLALLGALTADPRGTYVALADRLGLSRNTVQSRMGRLESAGALLAFDRRIDPAPVGYPLTAFLTVAVKQKKLTAVVDALSRIPEVLQAHGLSGTKDLLVQVAGADAHELFRIDAAILAIDGVRRTETSISMGELIPFRIAPLLAARRHRLRG